MRKRSRLKLAFSDSEFLLFSLLNDQLGFLHLFFLNDGIFFSLFSSLHNCMVHLNGLLSFFFGIRNLFPDGQSFGINTFTLMDGSLGFRDFSSTEVLADAYLQMGLCSVKHFLSTLEGDLRTNASNIGTMGVINTVCLYRSSVSSS